MRPVRNTLVHFFIFTLVWELVVGQVASWFLMGIIESAPAGEYAHLRFIVKWFPHLPLIVLTGFVLFAVAGAVMYILGKQVPRVLSKWESARDYPRWYTGRKRSVHVRDADSFTQELPMQCICGRDARSVEEYYDALIVAGIPVWRFDTGQVPACRHCLSGEASLLGTGDTSAEQVEISLDEEMEEISADAEL